jgi:hypothetical protein
MKRLFFYLLKKYCHYDQDFRIQVCAVLQEAVATQYYEDNQWNNFSTAAGEMMRANPLFRDEDRVGMKNLLANELDWINNHKINNG